MKTESLIHDLKSSVGSGQRSSVYQYTDIHSGKTELVIEKTIIERYPVTEYEKVMKIYDNLNRGGGRRLWSLNDLTK